MLAEPVSRGRVRFLLLEREHPTRRYAVLDTQTRPAPENGARTGPWLRSMGARSARYLEVAETLRRPILDGTLPPGSRLPSRAQLAVRHRVSEQVSRHALRLLVAEGLVESRPGSGYYVRPRTTPYSVPRTCRTANPVEPLRQEWIGTALLPASSPEATRLRIRRGESLYRTRCLGHAAGPVVMYTSWEPTALTRGTPHTPAEERSWLDPVDRLAAAGVHVDQVVESVYVRPARGAEATLLELAAGHPVLVIERTHYASQRPVEISDLVASTDRCELVYRLSPLCGAAAAPHGS